MIKTLEKTISRIRENALWRYFSQKAKTVIRLYLGQIMLGTGIFMVLFGPKIVDPFLVKILGPRIVFGKANVMLEEGVYLTTNQAALIKWIVGVMLTGLIIAIGGFAILWIKKIKKAHAESLETTHNPNTF